jgi:hypothetical protein
MFFPMFFIPFNETFAPTPPSTPGRASVAFFDRAICPLLSPCCSLTPSQVTAPGSPRRSVKRSSEVPGMFFSVRFGGRPSSHVPSSSTRPSFPFIFTCPSPFNDTPSRHLPFNLDSYSPSPSPTVPLPPLDHAMFSLTTNPPSLLPVLLSLFGYIPCSLVPHVLSIVLDFSTSCSYYI